MRRQAPKSTLLVEARLVADGCHKAVTLARGPRFLRFVVAGDDWGRLDALDQADDEPAAGERVIAAEVQDEATFHMDGVRNGVKFAEWRRMVTYRPVAEQPADDVLRDYGLWKAWCVAEAANRKQAAEHQVRLRADQGTHTPDQIMHEPMHAADARPDTSPQITSHGEQADPA